DTGRPEAKRGPTDDEVRLRSSPPAPEHDRCRRSGDPAPAPYRSGLPGPAKTRRHVRNRSNDALGSPRRQTEKVCNRKLTTAAIGSRVVRREKVSPLCYRRISKCSLDPRGSYPPISILMSVNLISGARSAVHRSMNSDGARKTCEPSRSVARAALFLLTKFCRAALSSDSIQRTSPYGLDSNATCRPDSGPRRSAR